MSNLSTFHFIKPGFHTLIQDKGRFGFQAFGVPVSGAMDKSSAKIGNWLVDNPIDGPVLEITFGGPKIVIEGDCQIALTGADLSPQIDQLDIPMYETINAKNGSTLSFGKIKTGCRSYLAIRGDWEIKSWLDSYSATAFGATELTPDSVIQKASKICIKTRPNITKKVYPREKRPNYANSLRVRMLPGPEFDFFSSYTIGYFLSQSYKLTSDSNRMGYRLDGNIQDFKPNQEIISSGTVPGTIQITNSGQPIILMADAQTSGGYSRLGNVISADLDLLGQLKPGDEIWFSLIRLEEAYLALEKINDLI